jgi:hypothetical protein
MTHDEAVKRVREEVIAELLDELGDSLEELRAKVYAPDYKVDPANTSEGIDTVEDARLVVDVIAECAAYIGRFGEKSPAP